MLIFNRNSRARRYILSAADVQYAAPQMDNCRAFTVCPKEHRQSAVKETVRQNNISREIVKCEFQAHRLAEKYFTK
jgi:hypothetical protein